VRVLHLSHYGSLVGGVEGYISDVSSALQKAGHRSHLVYFHQESRNDLIPDMTYAPLPEWPSPPIEAQQALGRLIAEYHPDVAYVHAVYHPQMIEWIARRLPTVAYVHGPYPVCPGFKQYLPRHSRICPHAAGPICLLNAQIEHCCWGRNPIKHLSLLKRIGAFVEAYRQVGVILVGSRFMQRLLGQGSIPPDRISILPPVLIADAPRPEPKEGSSSVLFAGRLTLEKGLRHLLKALATVQTEWQLAIAGDGEEREPCQQLARQLGISDRVHFLGWLDNAEMAAALQSCACVAVPSLWPEPYGRIGPEAFIHGRPVVAYAVGGIPDWLEDGISGYLIKPGDIDELGQRLESLLRSPISRREMGEQAWQRAASAWSAEKHIERLETLLERAVAEQK
jgi:glycosyltransferase involved in cell wall biosynthesis